MPKARLYFDYAASTPLDSRVEEAMRPYFGRKFGNAGSLHSFGQEAMAAVDFSREAIAEAIGAGFREVVFTASATEANNLALRGAVKRAMRITRIPSESTNNSRHSHARLPDGQVFADLQRVRIIVSAIEHESILETVRDLEREGVEVAYLPVGREGLVDLKKLKSALTANTVLVSVMCASNEIGTIQPINEISRIVRNFRNSKLEARKMSGLVAAWPLLHADAAQAFQFLDCKVDKLGVDLMTLSAHKIYGPKGVGALFVKHESWNMKQNEAIQDSRFKIGGIITGGGQEFGLRSGTENTPSIVGFAEAVRLVISNRGEESERVRGLKERFWAGLKKICPDAEVNGCRGENDCHSLPNILNVFFPKRLAEELLTKFDLAGLMASAGPACKSRSLEPSYVIEALGYSEERAKSSVRFSFGRPTTKKEVDSALAIIKKLLLR